MAIEEQRFEASGLVFSIRHEQWDANIHSHADQGAIIEVSAPVDGRERALLRFNCCDVERSYVYDPDGEHKVCQMDPIVDGNPVGWSVRQMRDKLAPMLGRAGAAVLADGLDASGLRETLDRVEAAAREAYIRGRRTVKHNRGTDIFEAGNIRFGLEMRDLGGDGGLAIHVLSDLVGTTGDAYAEETEILAFDCFRDEPHYHYGPRNKNHRYYWDKTIIPDPLEWTLGVLKSGKLKPMIEAAGYPGVAADLDEGLVASQLPALESKAREMQPKSNG